jgi:hypothetical protein
MTEGERCMTHHPLPALRATARGVDRGWNDDDGEEMEGRGNDGGPPVAAISMYH